ncbi:MAG: conjugal transfer protein TraN [Aquabacterium sp.]
MKLFQVSVAFGFMVAAAQAIGGTVVDAETIFKDAQSLGSKAQSDILGRVKSGEASGNVPNYKPDYPAATEFEKNPSQAYEKQSTACSSNPKDPTCAAVATATQPRPKVFVKLSDPGLAGLDATKAPEKILGNFSTTYNACTTGTPKLISPAEVRIDSCQVHFGGWKENTCNKKLNVITQPKYNCVPGTWWQVWDIPRHIAPWSDRLKAQVLCEPTRTDGKMRFRVLAHGGNGGCNDWQEIDVDMTTATTEDTWIATSLPHWGDPKKGSCRHVDVYQKGPGCKDGWCEKTFHFLRHGVEEYWINASFQKPYLVQEAGEGIDSTCTPFEKRALGGLPPDGVNTPFSSYELPYRVMAAGGQCIRTNSTCIDGPAEKVIDGIPVYKACWEYSNQFSCADILPSSTCAEPKYGPCLQAGSSTCLSPGLNGTCDKAEVPLECESKPAVYTDAINCGPTAFCGGGSCYDSSSQPNTEFAESLTYLNAAAEAAKEFDVNTQRIFRGKALKCKKKLVDVVDCCDGQTMLDAIGQGGPLLLACAMDVAQIAELQSKRDQGMCHQNWTWVSDHGALSIPLEESTSYCCFNSKLARIIVEQGRQQLGIAWSNPSGNPDDPNCEGFTVEQLQALDFSAMDLSAVYADIKVTIPAPESAITKSSSSVPNCYFGAGNCQ